MAMYDRTFDSARNTIVLGVNVRSLAARKVEERLEWLSDSTRQGGRRVESHISKHIGLRGLATYTLLNR